MNLVDARDGTMVWGEQFNRGIQDILSVQSAISKEISSQLQIKLNDQDAKQVSKQYTAKPEAYDLYLKGQYFLMQRTQASTEKALDYFHQAIEKDSSYALAYAGMADAYNYLGITGALLGGPPPKQVMPKAREAAVKALQLDETVSLAHLVLGHIYTNYDWDWDRAEKEFNRAIELNPSDSAAYGLKALFYVSKGESEQAASSIERFKELDPGYFPGRIMIVGIYYYWSRQYDKAITELQSFNEMAPNYPNPYFWKGASYMEKKDYDRANDSFQKAVTLSHRAPVALSGLGICYARAGKKQEAENVLNELLEQSKTRYVPEFYLGCLYGSLGNKDEAFRLLDKAYQEHANGPSVMKAIALADDLRSDPRFTELLKKLNLI